MGFSYLQTSKKKKPALNHLKADSKGKAQNLPNSLVMRVMEDGRAEQEADELSAGVTSLSPNSLKAEMGQRLGADFSSVRFHSDPDSLSQSRALGARAWTQGNDVYFGKGGYDSAVAAHELVHTVQQGAVSGRASVSIPNGAVQLLPDDDSDEVNKKAENAVLTAEGFEAALTQMLSSGYGNKVYQNIEKKLKDMIKKGAGKKLPGYSKEIGIRFLALSTEKDYTGKSILNDIIQKPMETKSQARHRMAEIEQYIKFITSRLGNYGLEDLAIQTNMIDQPPKYEHKAGGSKKRAYETKMPGNQEDGNVFNPNNVPELTNIQKQIDGAPDAQTAYSIFAAFTGNPGGKFKDTSNVEIDVSHFKDKLKHMTRVVYDYPELRNQIGDMKSLDPKKTEMMNAEPTVGGRDKAVFGYNPYYDRKGKEEKRNKLIAKDKESGFFNAPNYDFAGTHEMGHVLASLLPHSGDRLTDTLDENNAKYEDEILQEVIKNKDVMTDEQKKSIKYHQQDGNYKGLPFRKGQIDTKNSKFFENGITSKYGSYHAAEFFAEAFHDVYSSGQDAKPISKEIVKEYEKRQTQITKGKFFKKPSKWKRFKNFFRMLF